MGARLYKCKPFKTTFANSILMFALSGYGDDAKFVNGKDNDTWNGTWGSPDTRVITISNNPLVRRQGRTAINEMAGHLRNAYAAIGQYNIGSLELNASDRPDIINSELGSWISAVGNYKTVKFPILKMEISGIENIKVRFEANGDTTNSGSISSSISSSYTQNGGSGSGSGYGSVADVINALRINVDFLQAEKISTSELETNLANIQTAYIDYANIKSAFIDDLVADTIATEKLSASLITASTIEAITLRVEDAIVDNLDAKYAKIDFANVGSEAVKELFVNVGFMQDVTIENGKITGTLSGVRIIADVIEANEIIAGDMIVSHKNEDGTTTHFKINAEESGLTTEEISSLDYEHYLNGTDIVAHSITANEITTSNIKGAYGWINLAQGTFNYGDKLIWDGTDLTLDGNIYVRDGLDYLFTAIQGVYDEDGEVVTKPKVTLAGWEVTSNSLTNEYFTLSTSVSEDNIGSTSLYADNTNLLTLFGNVLSLSGNSIEIEGNNAISIDAPTITIDGSIKLAGTITQEGSKQTATTYTRTNVFTDLTNMGKATDSFVSMTFSSYGEAKNHASANLVGKYIVPQNTGDATTSYPKITSVVYQNYNVTYTLNKASNIARDGKFKVQTITSQTSVLSNPFKVDANGNVTCRAVTLGSSGSISSGNTGAVSGGVVYSYCYGKRIVGVTEVTCTTSGMIAKDTVGTATGSFTAISGATSYRVIPRSTAQYNIVSDNPTVSGTTVSVKCYNISGASHTLTARCLVLGLG